MSEQTPAASTAAPSPEAMRGAMAQYVREVHRAYLDAAATLTPGDRAQLPLLAAERLHVLAVGARNLHVLATTQPLPAPSGPEVELADEVEGLTWTLRFFDPVVAPGLGLIDESEGPRPQDVRNVLGVRTVVYHLTVPPGGGLTPHHALHAGTGLSHSHAAAVRDLDSIAALAPAAALLVDELRGAVVADLPAAQLLLARAIAPGSARLAGMAPGQVEPSEVRRALLQELREAGAR